MALQLALAAILFFKSVSSQQPETLTNLEFYLHDEVSGPNPTVTAVAGVSNGVGFGSVMVIDDALTEGPSVSSRSLGRAQGTYMMSSLNLSSLLLTFTAVFSDRNGTLSFHGADRFLTTREIAVVGGTGIYRLAQGYAVVTTHSTNNLSAILHFNTTFNHLDPSPELRLSNTSSIIASSSAPALPFLKAALLTGVLVSPLL